jgi:segregation and condensation protein B
MGDLFEIASEELEHIVEALVFAAEVPITITQITDVVMHTSGDTAMPEEADILKAIAALNQRYKDMGSVLCIEEWAGGFRMATIETVAPYLKTMFSKPNVQRLSRSVMETLSVIAYRQPVTKPEMDYVRGVNSDYAVRKLLESNFIEVIGRSDAVGQPLLYATTSFFLEQFGLNNLNDLPRLREIEELLQDPNFDKERQELALLEQTEALTSKQENRDG